MVESESLIRSTLRATSDIARLLNTIPGSPLGGGNVAELEIALADEDFVS